MQYTKVTGKEVLMWMIIGDGDALRTSRTNLFKDTTTAVGAYSGPHEGQGH